MTTDPSRDEGDAIGEEKLVYVGGVWLVLGDFLGRPTIWRSQDLETWDVAYHELRGGVNGKHRDMRWRGVVELGDRIVVGASGREQSGQTERDRSFLFVTEDGGQTWRSIEDPIVAESDRRLDGLHVSDGVLVADLLIDSAGQAPQPIPHRTSDLLNWEPIELPDAPPGTWAWWISDGRGQVAAIATSHPDSGPTTTVWHSYDGAKSFDRIELSEPLDGVVILPDSILAIPSGGRTCCYYSDGPSRHPGQVWLHDGTRWALTEADEGQWGDGGGWLETPVVDPGSRRIHAVVTRHVRSDPHYCWVDEATCQQAQHAVVATADGQHWSDVQLPSPPNRGSQLIAPGDGQLVVWWYDHESRTLQFNRWTGPGEPPTEDPPGWDPVEAPIALWTGEALEVGDEYRYVYGLGGCGGMHVNEIEWLPTEELDTTGWPIRDSGIDDGPSALVFGRIRLESPDQMSFIIEGQGVVATLHPRSEPRQEFCG
ncbi:MAG: hypothetical protein GY773_17785 [Actinomycetia bacterium]|nr:hypothetical protein [Actinomycetes bacterium]